MGKKIISQEEYERRIKYDPKMSYGQYITVYPDEELMCCCKYRGMTHYWKTDKKTGKTVCRLCGEPME